MEISAQVVLRAKGPITATTLAANQPPQEAVDKVRAFFSDAGFKLGNYVGISFSIAGPRDLFEIFFGTQLDKLQGYELPLDNISKDVALWLEAITFTPPPAFGPSGSGP